jgi:hypothetical protein
VVVPMDGSFPDGHQAGPGSFREAGMFTVPTGVTWWTTRWCSPAAGPQGVSLYRQRLAASTSSQRVRRNG